VAIPAFSLSLSYPVATGRRHAAVHEPAPDAYVHCRLMAFLLYEADSACANAAALG